MNKERFTDKYHPKTFDELICKEKPRLIKAIGNIKTFPNLFLIDYQKGGDGKDVIVDLVKSHFNIDILKINGSDKTSIDFIRNDVLPYLKSVGLSGGERKILFINECDNLSSEAKDILKSIIDEYSKRVIFILATNKPEKIDNPLRTRFITINLQIQEQKEVVKKLKFICKSEGINYNMNQLNRLFKDYTPSIREMYNVIENNLDEKNNLNYETITCKTASTHFWVRCLGQKKVDTTIKYYKSNNLNVKELFQELYKVDKIFNLENNDEVMKLFENYSNKIQNSNTPEIFFDNFIYQLDKLFRKNGSKNNQKQTKNNKIGKEKGDVK